MPPTSDQLPLAYRGHRTQGGALVDAQAPDGTWHLLDARLDLRNHSPTGFEWGYAGSGPAQLALALAASRLPEEEARAIYQRLKGRLVARLPATWHLEGAELDQLLAALLSADIADDLAQCLAGRAHPSLLSSHPPVQIRGHCGGDAGATGRLRLGGRASPAATARVLRRHHRSPGARGGSRMAAEDRRASARYPPHGAAV
jgi:hypothetical protein